MNLPTLLGMETLRVLAVAATLVTLITGALGAHYGLLYGHYLPKTDPESGDIPNAVIYVSVEAVILCVLVFVALSTYMIGVQVIRCYRRHIAVNSYITLE